MKTGKGKSIAEELTIALNTELSGYGFYKFAANSISDARGKNIFLHLASEELEHIDVISAISESLKSGKKGFLNYSEAIVAGLAARGDKGLPIFADRNELVDKFKTNPTDRKALEIGIEAEEKAVDSYHEMLLRAETPTEKVFLTRVLEMEKGHLKLLRWELESLAQNGFWGDFMEYSVEKEST